MFQPQPEPWTYLWLACFYGWFAYEIYLAIRTRTRHSTGNVRDRGTQAMLWVVMIVSISTAFWIGMATPANLFHGARWLVPLALAIILSGLLLRVAAVVTLGKSFSANVAISKTQTVLKTGLYRWMRHPSYTGMLIILLSVGIFLRNWISLLIVMIPSVAVLLYRIHIEEIALRNHFGQEYIHYSRQTRRLIPGVY
jgi:protein-S-isoprenylcysteine O-methyltransferase